MRRIRLQLSIAMVVSALSMTGATSSAGLPDATARRGGADARFRGLPRGGCPEFLPGERVGVLSSSEIAEASGLVASRQHADILWTHNDNTYDTRIFALHSDGTRVATYTVGEGTPTMNDAYDCEDIAIGPGPTPGVDYIFWGDVGDNENVRPGMAPAMFVLRFPEPVGSLTGGTIPDADIDRIVLAYPTGSDAPTHKDAETLLVDPLNGDIYVVTKRTERGRMYLAPYPQSTTQTVTMQFVAELPWGLVGGFGGATGGDVSPDGSQVIIRRYTWYDPKATIWDRPSGAPLWEAFLQPGCNVPLFLEDKGEAICFASDGRGYFSLSEGIYAHINYFALASCTDAVDCDDGNVCTDDACVDGFCERTRNTGPCDDGLFCTQTDTCVNSACVGTGEACPGQTCDEVNDVCIPCVLDSDCNDENPCTDDACLGGSCAYTNNQVPCDDGAPCTDTDVCSDGECTGTDACPEGEVCNPVSGLCEVLVTTLTFQDGVDGYAGTADTFLQEGLPGQNNGALDRWEWDGDDGSVGGGQNLGLLRFDDVFGLGPGLIPPGAAILSATLSLVVSDAGSTPAGSVYESAVAWDESAATWSNFGGEAGVQADELGSFVAVAPIGAGAAILDVTDSLRAWSDDPNDNLGWIFLPNSNDGVQVHSSEYLVSISERPKLTVTFPGAMYCDTVADCDDGNPCTNDACLDHACATRAVPDGTPCPDDEWCRGVETCQGGICVEGAEPCEDLAHCDEVYDRCVECVFDNECTNDDGPCAYDGCAANECNHPLADGSSCADSEFCNGDEVCQSGICTDGADPCRDQAHCDESNDVCLGCISDDDCDDGQFCNGVEACNLGTHTCEPGTAPDCSDGDGGTVDYCDPTGGACEHALAFDPVDGRITDSLWVSGMELGGLGVGKMELLTNGEIGHYTINNDWDTWVERTKGTFFAVHVDGAGSVQNRVLRRSYSGGSEYAGLEAIDHLRYLGMFPRAELEYFDELPVRLRLQAFSPLIPQNPADSSLPVAFFTFDVTNESSNELSVSLAVSWENILGRGGYDTWSHGSQTWSSINGNFQENVDLADLAGVRFRTTQSYGGVRDNAVGEYLLLAEKGAGLQLTTHNSWNVLEPTPAFWSTFENTGTLTDPASPPVGSDGSYEPAGTVAVKATLAPAETRQIRFLVVWYMPTHITAGDGVDHGHAYLANPATDSAAEIADYAHGSLGRLRDETTEWQDLVLGSNLPFWLKLRMINSAFTMFANSVYPADLHFYTHESLMSMRGSLGTSDQRMCFHPFYTMLFPGLDQDELTIFGDVRPGDGRVSHFNGNVGWLLHSSSVGYGVTNWPDLSCSYVMQVLKSYKWTGNLTFLNDNWPEVQEVMAWLQGADGDGDYIPEGGSTYDYEGQNPGAFIYTASAYLGALRAAEELARIKGDTLLADGYAARFGHAQATVMSNLWTGRYFKKYYRPTDGATNPNSFIASLAGDWLSRYATTGRTLDVDVTKSAENHILNWHQDLFADAVAPMEVTPDGDDPAGNCYQYQHEPYIGMESMYDGYVDEGLGILYRIYRDHWERARWPWNGRIHPSIYGDGKTGGWNGNYYMSNPATWSVLNALSGSSIDVPNETLYLAPHLPAGWTELHIPLFFPKFWALLDFNHLTGRADLEIVKVFGEPITISTTVAELASGQIVENTTEGLPFTANQGQILTYHIPVDNSPPSAIGDLSASWTGAQVQLIWTAPGDDGTTGRSLRYDIRHSPSAIDDSNWDQAATVTREPYPAFSGAQETFLVPDALEPDTTYYFAAKSRDEEGNWSALSNVDAVFTGGPECNTDDDCDDGLFCNGPETCDAQHDCQAGTPVDCSYLDDGCNAVGLCAEDIDQCVAETATDGMSCDDGDPCTHDDQCWSGVCQAVSLLPVEFPFNGGGAGGIPDGGGVGTGFTHLLPSSNGGGHRPANLDVSGGALTVTTTEGDFAKRSGGLQNNQDNALSVRIDAGELDPLRVSARLVAPWDLEDDYQSGGVVFGIDEDNYVKFTAYHDHFAFGGAENDDPNHTGFQLGLEKSSTDGSIQGTKHAYPAADGLQSVSTLDLHLELDPDTETVTTCYQVDGGSVVVLDTDLALSPDAGVDLFTACSYAGILHTNNDYSGGDPDNNAWHPHYDDFSVSAADADGDSYTMCDGDLDDHDEYVYPGAPEICDGKDNDGNGNIDDSGDTLCDDGWFCNGQETCAGVAGCEAGTDPCPGQMCRESDETCVNCLTDGDCADPLFCNGTETCDANGDCQPGSDPCPGQLCDEDDDTCVGGECVDSEDCDNGLFCDGAEACVDYACVDGNPPCADPCEQCDESGDSCKWCIYDLDGSGFIGPGDFSFFAGCYGRSFDCDPPDYRSGVQSCCMANFDEGSSSFVGPGDFSGFAGCFGRPCDECGTCWGSRSVRSGGPLEGPGAVVSVELVAVRVPTPADVADDLPRSARSFRVGETFYVELWVSLDGASDGLAAVYVDMKLDPTRLMFVEVIPGHFFGILSRGTWSSELGLIHSVGGCALLGEDTLGLNAWVRAATVKMHVRGRGTTVVETSQSTGGYGVAILNRLGTLDTSHIAFGEIALDLPGRAHLVDQLQEVEAQNEQTSQGRP